MISFLGVETFDCDREVAEIVSGGNNDGENNNGVSLSGIYGISTWFLNSGISGILVRI